MSAMVLVGVLAALVVVALAVPMAGGSHRTVIGRENSLPRGSASGTRQRRGRRRQRVLDHAYPDALDLFVVSVQAGHLPFQALVRIRPHVHPLIAVAIDDVARRVQLGQRLVDAMDGLVDALGTRSLAFVATVGLAERTGLAIAPMIDRIGDDARHHRRRRAEMSARELPVRLAVPLVLCTLPSFVLVAIAPLLIGALSSLRGT